ncbi:MAG: serine/threonine protein kinase [Deltaproteobacteria bacterium]|nr:serine/threonine protein kinase [Deltaproteobacteria bacterium]
MSIGRRRFRFIKEIAEGGFGKVYLAEQLSSDGFSRIVAIKLLHAKWSTHDEVVMRTRDEARLLGLIRHQNIVKVEDLTSIDGKCALVMEYLEGVDLKGMSTFLAERGETFPVHALFEIMALVASALDAAYNGRPLQGGDPLRVLHRDIKPSNVFLAINGQVKLLDFGTARANFAQREAKTQALAFGSQGYMAPERMLGEEDTSAADVFSLGVTLYELLTQESFGRIPPRPNKFIAKVEERVAAMPLKGKPQWNDAVRELVRKMLTYEPVERPSAAALVDLFEDLAQGAGDTPLRKFCRTSVAEAKGAEPDLDTGDPLVGATVDEDESSAFGVGAGGVPELGGASGVTDEFGAAPPPSQTPGDVPPPRPRPVDPPPRTVPQPRAVEPVVVAEEEDEEQAAKGGGMKVIFGAAAAIFGLGMLLVVVIGVAGGVWYYLSGQQAVSAPVVVEPPPEVVEAPAEPEFVGHVVQTPDARADAKRSPTVLKVSDPDKVSRVKVNGFGFDYAMEWDGKGELDLGQFGDGTYRTFVTVGEDSARGKFKIVGGKRACAMTFDVATRDWTGDCK